MPAELVLDPGSTKTNLIARLGLPDAAGLVLSGHTDVVPADGVPSPIDRLFEIAPAWPRGCLVGGPTGLQVVDAHKGKAGCRCTIPGRASRSAFDDGGVNPIEHAAEIVALGHRMHAAYRVGGRSAPGSSPLTARPAPGRSTAEVPSIACPGPRFSFEIRAIPGVPDDPLEYVARFCHADLVAAMRRWPPKPKSRSRN